jgi:hypothetical protein
LCNETFLALEPGSEIDPLLTLDEEAILFVARMLRFKTTQLELEFDDITHR